MNRCVLSSRPSLRRRFAPPPTALARYRRAVAGLGLGWAIALLLAAPAQAQVARNFPQNALRGEISFGTPPELLVNGQAARLAPAARIRDTKNMQVLSGTVMGQRAIVNYTIDTSGNVFSVWVLRPEEIANKPWPRTPAESAAWQFDPIAQTWTRP